MRYKYTLRGQVQGVGFRPFVYGLASRLSLGGFIANDAGGVVLEVEGKAQNLTEFEKALHKELPPLARIDHIEKTKIYSLHEQSFIIRKSDVANTQKKAIVPPDTAVCDACLQDMRNIQKYKDYFAINCTNCGPRYSIIKTVPYDRKNTSMSDFGMCESCAKEYNDPTNRRFHAQPIACLECGPQLALYEHEKRLSLVPEAIIQKTAALIEEGAIVAVKGMGGFHLVCDGTNEVAVQKLRSYKNRPTKPFALMCKDINQIQTIASTDAKEQEILCSKEAPIVVLKKRENSLICDAIAPNIDRIGCFLPYTPLQHLLFAHLQNPVVATSANLGEEPIIFKRGDITQKLPFAAYVLDNDREIVNAVDDSLVQVVSKELQMLRMARGYAPKVIRLPFTCKKKILAVGANQKNTLGFVLGDTLILSPHIGDLQSVGAFDFFLRTLQTFQRLYDFEPELIVCDKHPHYKTTQWAKAQDKPILQLGHHLAHIYACKAEYGLSKEYLGFSFDGTGYGEDGTLWGGEVFVGDERRYSFAPIRLLGGEKAVKEPRRIALAMLFEHLSLDTVLELDNPAVKAFTSAEIRLLHQSYVKELNAPKSSSVGRLFDGVCALGGVVEVLGYEGESGLLCETFYDKEVFQTFSYKIEKGIISVEILKYLLQNKTDKKELCSMLINTLVHIMVEIAKKERMEVILSGGVFQNKTLLEATQKALKELNIPSYCQSLTPVNDGGIALGQLYYAIQKEIKHV
jgi:hydrogenase maturation protein HypF